MIDAQAALEALAIASGQVEIAIAEKDTALSALSLQVDGLSEANIALQAELDTARATIVARDATIAELKAKLPPEPKTVRDYGAKLDGVTDDTAAIQKAIDAGDGVVPDGVKCVIDPLKTIVIGPGKKLQAGKDTQYLLKPNAAERYCGFRVEGGSLIGGQIIGDRKQHVFTAGSTHEWGYGFQVRGDGSYVADLLVKWCTGDGFGVSGTRHKFDRVVSVGNRRQGASGFTGDDWEFNDCVFADTGALDGQAGANPRAGFDCEPDKGACNNVRFNRCRFSGNNGGGLVMWTRADGAVPTPSVTNVQVNDCTFSGSANAIHGKSVSGVPMTLSVKGCNIKRGSGVGIKVDAGLSVTAEGNTFSTPTDRTDFTLTGMDSRTRYDIQVLTGGKANVGTNRYV